MGYDRYAERLVDEKAAVLSRLVEDGTRLVYTHDPHVAASRVVRDDRGRFAASEPLAAFTRWDLDEPAPPVA
jgi:hypothetical protein